MHLCHKSCRRHTKLAVRMKKLLWLTLLIPALSLAQVQSYPPPPSGSAQVSMQPGLTAGQVIVGVSQSSTGSVVGGGSTGTPTAGPINGYSGVVGNLSLGTSGSPNTVAGPLFKSTYIVTSTTPHGNCTSANDSECVSAIEAVTQGVSGEYVTDFGATLLASTSSVNNGGAAGLYSAGYENGSGTGIGTGAYLNGVLGGTAGKVQGTEIRASNNSGSNCALSYSGVPQCVGVWLSTDSSANANGSAVETATNAKWQEGVTLNNGSVSGIGFNDESSSTTAFEAGGTHTYSFIANSGWAGIGTLTPGGPLDVEGGTAATSTSGANISLVAQSAGSGGALGGQVAIVNGAGATNGFLNVTTAGSSGNNDLRMTRTSTGGQNAVGFYTGGNLDWLFGYNPGSNPAFFIFDSNGGRTPITFNEGGAITINPTAGGLTISNVSTGTNADFLCLGSGGVVQLQSSACTISSERFKEDINPFTGDALAELLKLDVESYKMKGANRDPNGSREQIGIIAESVSAVEPKCAIYEDDLKTPKSYRPECITALLVAAAQEHVSDTRHQFELIYALMAGLLLLSVHSAHLHMKVRRLAA